MIKVQDLIGQRFGRLVVIRLDYKKQKYKKNGVKDGFEYYWFCKCDCGNTTIVRAGDLKSGNTQSCGCLHKEKIIELNTIHNARYTRLYTIWNDIKIRCFNPKARGYYCYGGRGITICDEWKDNFQAFYDWAVSNGYTDKLTIDRIDNNKGYSPDNCKWGTQKQQVNNRRTNRLFTYKGQTYTIKQWSEIVNINYITLYWRLIKGKWSIEKALMYREEKK